VDHCRNGGLIGFEDVDNPITVSDELADVFVVDSGTLRPDRGKRARVLVEVTIVLTTAFA
jgi:hypothetical protein